MPVLCGYWHHLGLGFADGWRWAGRGTWVEVWADESFASFKSIGGWRGIVLEAVGAFTAKSFGNKAMMRG